MEKVFFWMNLTETQENLPCLRHAVYFYSTILRKDTNEFEIKGSFEVFPVCKKKTPENGRH